MAVTWEHVRNAEPQAHPTFTKPQSALQQDAQELFQLRVLLSFLQLLQKSTISTEARDRHSGQSFRELRIQAQGLGSAWEEEVKSHLCRPCGNARLSNRHLCQSSEVMHDYEPSTQEAEAGGSCQLKISLGHRSRQSQRGKKKKPGAFTLL